MAEKKRLKLFCFLATFLIIRNAVFNLKAEASTKNKTKQINIEGDIILGGLFTLHFLDEQGICSLDNSLRGIQEIEAMLYSIDKINANDTILPNITLGVKAFDTCGDVTSALNSAVKEFVLGKEWKSSEKQCSKNEQPVMGVIGPGYSKEAAHITPFLNLFQIPLVSYSATSVELTENKQYEYFSRTTVSDDVQIAAIINLLDYFNWTYVSVLYTDEIYGKTGYEGLKKEADKRGIHFAKKIEVPQGSDKERTFNKEAEDVLSDPEAKVIIIFGVASAMKPLMDDIQKRAGNDSIIFVCSDTLASAINEEHDDNAQRITKPTFFTNLPTKRLADFREYFINLSLNSNERNPWFKEFFQNSINKKSTFNINQTLAESNLFVEYNFTQSAPMVIDAVYAFAHALDDLITCKQNVSRDCLHQVPGDKLLSTIRSQAFLSPSGNYVNFTPKGNVFGAGYNIYYTGKIRNERKNYYEFGRWVRSRQTLEFDQTLRDYFMGFRSSCDISCSSSQYRKEESKKPAKCWECGNCTRDSYAVNVTCYKCPVGMKADQQRKTCVKIIPTYLTVDGKVISRFVIILALACATLGLLSTFFVLVVFVRHRNTPLVKASGRELTSLLLLGILLAFLFPFVAIAKPSILKCFSQFVMSSLPYTVCFVAIVVRNNRTHRIFNQNRIVTMPPAMIRPRSQILVSLGLIAFQLVLLTVLISLEFPKDGLIYVGYENIKHVCVTSEQQTLLAELYNIALLIACTYYGYKTKNIPRNFNEAKYIAFAMYGICVSMLAFGVVYILSSRVSSDYGVVVETIRSILVGFIIIACFFAPKVYLILCKPDQNTKNLGVATTSTKESS